MVIPCNQYLYRPARSFRASRRVRSTPSSLIASRSSGVGAFCGARRSKLFESWYRCQSVSSNAKVHNLPPSLAFEFHDCAGGISPGTTAMT